MFDTVWSDICGILSDGFKNGFDLAFKLLNDLGFFEAWFCYFICGLSISCFVFPALRGNIFGNIRSSSSRHDISVYSSSDYDNFESDGES